jgi:hypothetical protein
LKFRGLKKNIKMFKKQFPDSKISDLYRMLWSASKLPLRWEEQLQVVYCFSGYPTGAKHRGLSNKFKRKNRTNKKLNDPYESIDIILIAIAAIIWGTIFSIIICGL